VTRDRENPLIVEWNTPFGVPPFDLIESEDYLPALRASMRQHRAEIDAIAGNPDAPTFDNTIVALEVSGALLRRVQRVFYAVDGAHSDDVIRETGATIAPEFAAHRDDTYLNAALFQRVDTLYSQRDELDLDAEQRRLLEETHKDFVRAGANLEDDVQARLREINAELASLSQQFQENLLDETNDFELLVTNRADLGDLPRSLVRGLLGLYAATSEH
jgi:peptidyl-dipeptidase Dcp